MMGPGISRRAMGANAFERIDMFRTLSSVLLCFVVQVMAATASDSWDGADMQLIYHPGLAARSFQVGFKGKEMPIKKAMHMFPRGLMQKGVEVPGENVHEVVRDQVLAGYSYLPQVPHSVRQDPVLREHGVREFICSNEYFSSKALSTCVDVITENLQKGQGTACVRKHLGWRDFPLQDIKKSVYPAGRTRLWRAIPVQNVTRLSRENRVCFVFRGEDVALEGVLAPQVEDLLRAVKSDSLWMLKNVDEPRQSPVCAQKTDATPKLSDFLNPACTSNCDFGVLYCSLGGAHNGALFSCEVKGKEVTINVSYAQGLRAKQFTIPIVECLQREMLRGFVLKNKKASSKKNDKVLMRPEIRDVACAHTAFTSGILDSFLDTVEENWDVAGFRSTEPNSFWNGLAKEHMKEAKGLNHHLKEWEWSVVSQEDVDEYLEKEHNKYAMFILCRGAGFGVKGHPVFKTLDPPDHASLRKYAVRSFLKNQTT